MSTYTTNKTAGRPISDLFLSILGPVLVAAIVLLLAMFLNIL